MPDGSSHRNARLAIAGLILNAILAGGKFVAGWLGHSQALIADAVESLADIVSSLIVWRGIEVASQPADKLHPYGHAKAESIAAVLVSGLLLAAALGLSIDAAHSFFEIKEVPSAYTLWVLIGVIIIKEGMYRLVLTYERQSGSPALHADAFHHRMDAITSLAAALGISIALVGGPKFAIADSIAALVAAGIIFWNGIVIMRRSFDDLMDASPRDEIIQKIIAAATGVPKVHRIEKCKVRKAGHHYLVDMHVEVAPEMTVKDAHEVAHQVKHAVKVAVGQVEDVLIHIEPRR